MTLAGLIVLGFLLLNLLFGFGLKKSVLPAAASVSDFILANRQLGGFTLLATLAASNLSAFTIFGVSGAAYRSGWAFLPVMAFGTGFMALSFVTIGLPLRRLALAGQWTTPAHLVSARLDSPLLGTLFSLLSLLYTLPYLAVQTGAAGNILAQAGGFPRSLGAALIASLIALYVFRGGLRSVARTDILQFFALLGLGLTAFIIIGIQAGRSGLWQELARSTTVPGPNARTGADSSQSIVILAGYYLLWSLANPMFPHFIQRFYAAADDKALLRSMVAYPLVCVTIFVPMVAIGVLGSRLLPGLGNQASDTIFSLLSARMAGPIWGPVFTLAALAALMSTMDSQLLSCSSILVEDFLPKHQRSPRMIGYAGLLLAFCAWLVALKPPASILGFLGSTAFPGYASLAPVALAAIYLPDWYRKQQGSHESQKQPILVGSAALALLTGTGLVIVQAVGLRPKMPAIIFNTGIQSAILLAGILTHWIRCRTVRQHSPVIKKKQLMTITSACLLLIIGLDWWNFGKTPRMAGAIPVWVWYHAAACIAMAVIYSLLARYILRRSAY